MTKPTKWHVCPAKTQISLGIRPVWSETLLYTQLVAKDPSFLHADSKDWLDWANAQADLSLCWAYMPFCWFCHEAAHFVPFLYNYTVYLQLSLSAASPIYRGRLSDLDTRWTVISQSVDDRTEEERGLKVSVTRTVLNVWTDSRRKDKVGIQW